MKKFISIIIYAGLLSIINAQWPFGKDVQWYIDGPKKNGLSVIMIVITDGETGYTVVGLPNPKMSKSYSAKRQLSMVIKIFQLSLVCTCL